MKSLRYLSAIALLVVVAACEDDRTSVFTPIGDPSYDFNVSGAMAGLPSGTVATGAGSVTYTLSGLRDLSGATYNFWVVNADAVAGVDVMTPLYGSVLEFFMRDSLSGGTSGDPVGDPITGDVIMVLDTNIIADTGAVKLTSYAGTSNEAVFAVEIIGDSTADGSDADTANAVVVSISGGGSNDMILWRRIAVGGGGAMSFGNFGGSDVISTIAPDDYVYPVIGVGRAGVRGDEFSVDFQRIARPPHGYYYVGYMMDEDGNATVIDTLRSGFSAVAAENRVNLFNADVDDLLPQVVGIGIESSQVRNCVSGSAVRNCQSTLATGFAAFRQFVLALEPKAQGAGFGRGIVYAGDIPEIVYAQ